VPAGQVERTTWLVQDCLFDSEPGVHAELSDGQGRNLLLFRPHGGRRRVIDLDTQLEALPPRFDDGNHLDELLGSDPVTAGPALAAFATAPIPLPAAQAVISLSAVDQVELWRDAERLVDAQRHANEPRAADALPSDPDASPVATAAGSTGADDGRPLEGARPGPVTKARGGARKHRRRSRLARSHRAARGRLNAPGALDGAQAAWRAVAGEVPVEQACALRPAIEVCAGARSRTVALAAVSSAPLGPNPADDGPETEPVGGPVVLKVVADVLAAVLDDSANLPQALVLPPPHADPAGLQLLLDVLPDLLTDRQVIAITSDPDVADWAGLEAHAGQALTARSRAR
jgi:hypothetical protein